MSTVRAMSLVLALLVAASAAQDVPRQVPANATAISADSNNKPIAGEIPVTTRSPEAAQLFLDARGRALQWDCTGSLALLQKALALDPDFPLALAWLGNCEEGPTALPTLEHALALAANLSLAERTSIEMLLASKRGDAEQVRRLRRRLVDLAPNDWRVHAELGLESQRDHKSQAAILHLKRAVELNPKAAEAYKFLAYAYAEQGMGEEGIAAARKFVELSPDEANAHDTLANVLMLVGRLDEAEAEYRYATETHPDFWSAWAGLAYTRFYRGNLAGGRDAIAKGRKLPRSELESRELQLIDAWALLGTGHSEEALQGIDALEHEAVTRKSQLGVAWARFERAEMLVELSRLADADAQLSAANLALADVGTGPGPSHLHSSLVLLAAILAAREGKPAVAQSAVASLAEELHSAPSFTDARSALHHAEGEAALAAHNPEAAIAPLSLCPNAEIDCRLDLSRAQDEAGQHHAADETRSRMLALYLRDDLHHGDDPTALYRRLKTAAIGR